MFKLESYITPIILSYVNRYINNFRPEDSQVSLWGGDATFHNLELNLEVIEEELQLPFSFVSGNIRELSIHVPWTKITSEPIKITINTIECILNLKGKGTRPAAKKKPKEKPTGQSKTVEAPPGYIQSLINRIVSNISIHCNNLILKYVEEDIVLSMNVKLLKFESGNEKWEPAYTDSSPVQVILRKLITITDLTLCLDKRNASGKIEIYQEPMLYKCSMTVHLLRHYHSATANVASTTRMDIYCNSMEFSMTEQQVPMLIRLLMLLHALHQKQLKQENDLDPEGASSSTENKGENQEDGGTWTGWAWSYVSSVLPAPWEEELAENEESLNHNGHTLHFGFYVDHASITFKVSESNNERGYYSHKKSRYHPMLTLNLQGMYSDTLIHGLQWFNCTGGISEAILMPTGSCSCGHLENTENQAPYLKLGSVTNFHKIDSLFDIEAIENKGGKRQYTKLWDHHMATTTESVLLEKTPAYAFDYAYNVEVPTDRSSDILLELGSNLEFSNLPEVSALRLCIGPFKLRICSGLIHRLSTINVAASFYDYPPYYTLKPDLSFQDLLPPSADDYDALTEFIPIRTIRVTFFAPLVEMELLDHAYFNPSKECLYRKAKKMSIANMPTSNLILPKISIECQFIDISQQFPMHVNRLIHTTCQLPDPPKNLFEACYTKLNIKVVDLLSRIAINPACQSIILTPCSVSYSDQKILKPQYWTNSDIPHNDITLESENFTVNLTKPKALVINAIIEKLLSKESESNIGRSIYGSSLLTDACKDFGFPYMEISIDGIRFKKVITNSTQTMDISIGAIKAFIFETVVSSSINSKSNTSDNNIQQVLFISGPEVVTKKDSNAEDAPLFTLTVQFPLKPDEQKHPPILIFNLQEIRICVDPLLCKWLLYVPKKYLLGDIIDIIPPLTKAKSFSEASGSAAETPRKLSTNKLESVHSTSDQKISAQVVLEIPPIKEEKPDVQEKVYNILKKWFDVWKGMFLCGDVSQCTIYFPMSSLSAIGAQGIQEAVDHARQKKSSPDILVITLPFANIRSTQRQNVNKHLKHLPVSLPENIWAVDKSSFPWTMSISDLSCYTLQQDEKLIFLKPVSLSATVGLSTRPAKGASTVPDLPTATDLTSVDVDKKEKQEKINKKSSSRQLKQQDLIIPVVESKRKNSRNTNQSAASSSYAQHGKSNSSSTPNKSPNNNNNSRTKKFTKEIPISSDSSSAHNKVDIGYLGVCVHIDTTPIQISTSETQVYLFASVLYGVMEVAANLLPSNNSSKSSKLFEASSPSIVKKDSSTTLSQTQIREENTFLDNLSHRSAAASANAEVVDAADNLIDDSVKLTAWIQWTITRFSIELMSTHDGDDNNSNSRLKLVIDFEDIVSSLDFQSVYLKIKSKIGSASIQHYQRSTGNSKWQTGAFSGIVMRLRDDLTLSRQQDDNSLISVTITRASCKHTHTLWGAIQKRNQDIKHETSPPHHQFLSNSRYITEIVVNIQPLDFILSLNTLRNFYLVLIPLINIPVRAHEVHKAESISSHSISFLSAFNNQTLPLAYLDCQELRVFMPSEELLGNGVSHDTIVFQLMKITLNPQAVNPICRNPIRSDIYDKAAAARLLTVPGSEVEDRQYQLDVTGISICSGVWSDINSILTPTSDLLSNLRGMSENPALEWNILDQGHPNTIPSLSLRCILEKFDISIVAAPSMVYKDIITICGHSMEINLVSDIFVNLSLQQIHLLSAIFTEFVTLITPLILEDGVLKKPKIKFPYASSDSFISEKSSEIESIILGLQNKDSGIETSDVKSIQSTKVPGSNILVKNSTYGMEKQQIFPRPPNTNTFIYSSIPIELFLTAGKIGLSLYSVDDERNSSVKRKGKKKKISKKSDEDQGYEASEESTDDKSEPYKKYVALLYVCFTQPNVFFAKQQIGRKLKVSCFDVSLKISGPEYITLNHVPLEENFTVNLLETKTGTLNPSNGVPPAFFTLSFLKSVGKNSRIELDILRPTKLLCQTSKWNHVLSLKDKVFESFRSGGGSDSFMTLLKAAQELNKSTPHSSSGGRTLKIVETFTKFQKVKDILGTTNSVSLKFDQLILAILSETGHELHVGVREFKNQLFLTSRPEKICLMTSLDCITLTVVYNEFRKLLLNPWTISFDIAAFWESWQDLDSNPQVQITAESDCILVDISAEQLKSLELVLKDFGEFFALFTRRSNSEDHNIRYNNEETKIIVEKDQHYKDDLRAGAFQFVDSNTENSDEIPLPYQVMFWTKKISAMAWKYPQPRALTKVRIFPVPFKMALNTQENISVLCHLEYWSECRNCYLPFTQFSLSESEICHLNLPQGCPKAVVASTWRVVITTVDEETEEPLLNKGSISPRALAACMRIDSYFNKSLVPSLNVALFITKLDLAFYNYLQKNDSTLKLPDCLKKFSCDFAYPESQKFLTVSLDSLCAFFSTWESEAWSSTLDASISTNILDYAYLTEQTFIEPFTARLEICLLKAGLQCNLVSKPFSMKFGPSIAHTFAVSTQIWSQTYNNNNNNDNEQDFIITTRYVICNDTNVPIRFGQRATDESILVSSRAFHLYSWRSQKKGQQLRICVEESEWIWSKPFSVSKEGTEMLNFQGDKSFHIFVSIKDLSKTQKQITFFGQLIVCNMLAEHFEMKITQAVSDNKELEFRNARIHIITGKCAAPSIFIDNTKTYYLRFRFYGLESSWTGDIPLREHAIGSQPWLVKVPLQERGQFLSIWCRIFIQDYHRSKRILAMLWPLFMIKSNLPMSVKVNIETPTLGVNLDSVINGKGELQQLYCPGTIDHSHQITFKLEEDDNSNVNNPYVPLNYTLVDQREFFRKFPNEEEIEVILESLNHCFQSKWPYFDSETDNIEWIMDESQPLTHVQFKYHNACEYSPALLVELLPWCLIVNTLGTTISLLLNGIELCTVQHHGIIAPPKLEENFHLGIGTGNNWFFSGPLQLAKSDWSQSFYMPKINGNIPMEGLITTCIKCDTHLCMISITSSMKNEIRLLHLASTHILSNHLNTQIHVIGFAIPDSRTGFTVPNDLENHSFVVAPHSNKNHSGIPIINWYMLKQDSSTTTEYVLYIAFSINPKCGWSCPIRIDNALYRKAFSLANNNLSIPVVLTAQVEKGQFFLSIHNDSRPQIFIENTTNIQFYCGQALPDDSSVVKECEHFKYNCLVPSSSSVYYNMPLISEKFPELPQHYFPEKIAFACDPFNSKKMLEWSAGVSIVNNNALFIRVPFYGDVKLTIVNTACTTFLTIEGVSQVEISAKDIRVRLTMQEKEVSTVYKSQKHLEAFIKQTSYESSNESLAATIIADTNNSAAAIVRKLSSDMEPKIEESNISNLTIPSRICSQQSGAIFATPSKVNKLFMNTLPLQQGWESFKMNIFIKSIGVTLISDTQRGEAERWEIASLVCDDIVVVLKQTEQLKIKISTSDIQFDNQLYTRESFDFPVVLIGQERRALKNLNILSIPMENLLENCENNELIIIDLVLETWFNEACGKQFSGVKTMKISMNPTSCFIEDIYVTRLMQYLKDLNIINLVLWPKQQIIHNIGPSSISVNVPELVAWQCSLLAHPLTMRTFLMNPISMLISVHSSMRMYIALDQSPLQFGRFERKRIFTTSYRLGHALTMHYLSGAIFGAGWVVSSLELLGSPGGLARAMGTGLRDFVSLPYRGLVQGPMAFLRGITTGSASLMRHVTAGTLQSVTKLASSVARNLDRLTLDQEHQRRIEEQRKQRPQGITQGFMQGMTNFGISLLGAVGGIAHHPLQSMMSSGASPRSLAAGVGLGLVGVFTKPLSGAAELLALTGQGLLQGAGWNSLPIQRNVPQILQISHTINSTLKYPWKFSEILQSDILFVAEATHISLASIFSSVSLILTVENIVIVKLESDDILKMIPLNEITLLNNSDPTILSLRHMLPKISKHIDPDKVEDELTVNMDPDMRARVENYVRSSTVGLLNPLDRVSVHSDLSVSPLLLTPNSEELREEAEGVVMNFYITSQKMKYFVCLLNLATQQRSGNHFPVL